MDWITGLMTLLSQWQVLLPVLAIVAGLIWLLMRYGVQKPKIAKMIEIILESSKDWLSSVLGDKFGLVFDAILQAAKAVADGDFTKEEALATAQTILANALKVANVTLSDDEMAAVNKVIGYIIDAIMHDKAAAKQTIKSL